MRLNLSKRQQSGLINLSAGTTACALHQQVEAQILNLDCKLQKGPIHIFETEPLQEIGWLFIWALQCRAAARVNYQICIITWLINRRFNILGSKMACLGNAMWPRGFNKSNWYRIYILKWWFTVSLSKLITSCQQQKVPVQNLASKVKHDQTHKGPTHCSAWGWQCECFSDWLTKQDNVMTWVHCTAHKYFDKLQICKSSDGSWPQNCLWPTDAFLPLTAQRRSNSSNGLGDLSQH